MPQLRGYTLTQWLGSGGMGEVYQAWHADTQRTVAIKLLRRVEQAERFRNEAAVQATLRHPNIALVYEFFIEGGQSCLVMEYIDGPTIEQQIRKAGPMSEETAFRLLEQVASALQYLHGKEIVHRDLKTGNIKITRSGTVKLLDFGLARLAGSPKLTHQGYLVGTASSMAPEQFSGESSAASDCWALGVLLYEMLTGYAPFGGNTESEIGRLIRKADYIPPRKLNAKLSRTAERLIDRLLTVSPQRRLTAAQVVEALRNPQLLDSPDWLGQMRKWWERVKP
ncbi:serine/threonine-protein kinase [Larkinella soli]|uniref:serine/threonine-protein kinase n=1 Tax=Larkinella soli TaxID=1770527 RepID=UPI000FFC4452|nr:serine/threonine-protein kinase [Larkinella soli]